jgi:hypothetical protein
MKHFLYAIFLLVSLNSSGQKYVLVDKKMRLPVTYVNTISILDSYNGYFPIDKNKIKEFITEIDKIAKLLSDPKTKKPETIDFLVGSTTVHGLRVLLGIEERMDIVLTTNYGKEKSSMHLSDAKISNASNAFFINTWLKYLRSYIN